MRKSYFDIWRKNIPIVSIFLIAGFVLSWIRVSKEQGFFESSASIWIKIVKYEKTSIRDALSFLNPQLSAGGEVNTQRHLIKSRLVLKDVVKKFDLASDKKGDMARMVNFIKSRITVTPIAGSKLIKITARWDNAEMATKLANAVAHAYIAFTFKEQQDAYDEIYNLQDEQVKLAKQKLMKSDSTELIMRSINEKVYLMMLEMREDTRLNKAMSTRGIQLLEPAFEAVFRGTRKKLKLFLGTLIGLLIGIGTVMMKEYLSIPLWPEKEK